MRSTGLSVDMPRYGPSLVRDRVYPGGLRSVARDLLIVDHQREKIDKQCRHLVVGRSIPVCPQAVCLRIPVAAVALRVDVVARAPSNEVLERVRSAGSFRGAEAVVLPLVPLFAQFTDQEVDDFALAVVGNSEVWDAGLCASKYIPEFVKVNGLRISQEAVKALLSVLPDLEIAQSATKVGSRQGAG